MIGKDEEELEAQSTRELLEAYRDERDPTVVLKLGNALRERFETNGVAEVEANLDSFLSCMTFVLNNREMSTDSFWSISINAALASLKTVSHHPQLVEKMLPFLFHCIVAGGTQKNAAWNIITGVLVTDAKLLASYTKEVFGCLRCGFDEGLGIVSSIHQHNPEDVEREENLAVLLELFNKSSHNKLGVLCVWMRIVKRKPLLIAQYLPQLKESLRVMTTAGVALEILKGIARANPGIIIEMMDELKEVIQVQPMVQLQRFDESLAPLLTFDTRRAIKGVAEKAVKAMAEALDSPQQGTSNAAVLMHLRSLAEISRRIIQPYMDKINQLKEDPEQSVRDQAHEVVNFMEEKHLGSLSSKLECLNETVKQQVVTFEDLQRYLDGNIAEVKNFLAEVTKALPTPVMFSDEGIIRRTLVLHFACSKGGRGCLYTKDKTYRVESDMWNKWLKVAIGAVKLGKAAFMWTTTVSHTLEIVKLAYEALCTKYDKDFNTYCREPFLTSEEQDMLIRQLRENKFFGAFMYDSETAGWVCTRCHASAEEGPLEPEEGRRGWLWKRSMGYSFPFIKTWGKRMFALTPTHFVRYRHANDVNPSHVWPLHEIRAVEVASYAEVKRRSAFWMRTDKMNLLLAAENDKDMVAWMDAIKGPAGATG